MTQKFEDVVVIFREEDEQASEPIPTLWLLDNGWLKAEMRVDGGGTVTEYFSPYEVRSFYEM